MMKGTIKFTIFFCLVLGTSSEQYILGDVKIDDHDGTLQIYFTTNKSTGTMDWVSIFYRVETVEAIANVACRQLGFVGAIRFGPASQNYRKTYSFTSIECPTVSDYQKYGELHILRCSLEGPILTTNDCYPVTIICDLEHLINNPYEGQVSIEYDETGTLSDGVLKVFFGGKWNYVCYNNNFPTNVAVSVCRQKGYTGCSLIDMRRDVGNKALLLFSNYHCTQSSFACFSHCITDNSYVLKVCQDKVFLQCEFNSSETLSRSSGSSSQCALTSTSTNISFEYATWVLTGVVVILILIIVVIIVCVCCYFKCYRRGVNRNRNLQDEVRLHEYVPVINNEEGLNEVRPPNYDAVNHDDDEGDNPN